MVTAISASTEAAEWPATRFRRTRPPSCGRSFTGSAGNASASARCADGCGLKVVQPAAASRPGTDRACGASSRTLPMPARRPSAAFGKTRVGPLPTRLRPVRGGAEQPRRAYGVYDVAPEAWISVPVPPLVDAALAEAVGEQLAENRQR